MRAKTITHSKAYCFDFDDSLVKTPAKIYVYRNNVFIKALTPKEYNFYVYNPKDQLDFTDFLDKEMILNAKKYKAWPILKNVSNAIKTGKSTSEIFIITARDTTVKPYIYEFLKKNGIIIDIDHIITLGDNSEKNFNIAVEKKRVLEKLSKQYDLVTIFDDNPKTIQMASSIPNIKTRLIESKINEKFVEDSDPISDLGIGLEAQIKKFLKEKGYDYNLDEALWLCICAKEGKLDFVNVLLDKGANVHAWNDKALRDASYYGHKEVVELLLKHGANVHTGDDYALRWASFNGHKEVVELLLKYGANVHARDDYALQWATKNGHTDMVKLLKDHIAKEKKGLVKESLLEKFTEDSDPIKDMKIGGTYVNFGSVINKTINKQKIGNGIDEWLNYLRNLEGKKIYGKFRDVISSDVMRSDSHLREFKTGYHEFRIQYYHSYNFGEELVFIDSDDYCYKVDHNENYFIYDK